MKHVMKSTILIPFAMVFLTACVSVPRSETSKLADAGIAATNALSTNFRSLSSDFAYIDKMSAFADNYTKCSNLNPKIPCTIVEKSAENLEAGRSISRLINNRANAIDGLRDLYQALKREAEYDARLDIIDAVMKSSEIVQRYADTVEEISGIQFRDDLPSGFTSRAVQSVAGAFFDSQQKKRILNANDETRKILALFQEALKVETTYYNDIIRDNIFAVRANTTEALLKSGFVENISIIMPVIEHLNLTPNHNNSNQNISRATNIGIEAYIKASSTIELDRHMSQYNTAIEALNALTIEHDKLGKDEVISLDNIQRLIDEIDNIVFPKDIQEEN